MSTLLSFVIPCYRSEYTIKSVIDEIIDVVEKRIDYDYEIIAVNDCSPDNVYGILLNIAEKNKKVKVVNLAKNMGKHSAMLAGYSVALGDYIVNLDDDMQCPVPMVWDLIDRVVNDECDCAVAEYYVKKESLLKRIGSDFNLLLSSFMIDKPFGMRFENFSVIKKFVMDEIIKYRHPYPYFEGLLFRVTQRVMSVKMKQRERADFKSSGFNVRKSLTLVLNGLTAFSVRPLQVASFVGVLFSLLGVIYGLYVVIRKIIVPDILIGYSSILSIILFSSGLIMLMLGIVGEYLGRIYICLNQAPQYVIRNMINVEVEK